MEEMDFENRIVTPEYTSFDDETEVSLRPMRLDDYIGQDKVKENLSIYIKAAKQRNESLDHVLLYGPPGLGKTTLSHIIASEMGSQIKVTSGPAIEHAADLAAILTNLNKNDVLFIDEIHRLNRSVEEILYPAMEDFALDFIVGKGPSARSMRLKIQPFTLIGATTKAGALSGPLRDRFGIVHRLEFYSFAELKEVVKRTAKILDIKITEEGAGAVAMRSRGTPRIANRLVKRVSDYAIVKADGVVDEKIANHALDNLNIDKSGLDATDRALLTLIADKYQGGPVGLETLAAALGEDSKTIEEVYEPFLLQEGFIQRTPRGRKITPFAAKILGLKLDSMQQSLF